MSIVANKSELMQLQEEMAEQSAAFETAPAGLIVAWAVDRFGSKLTMASSFQEAVLIDIAVQVDPKIEVVFLDTGSHFPETLEYVETGLKRVDAPTRREAPIVAYDESWGMVKVNPLATWTEQDIAGYGADHGIPRHPLLSKGYLSIGCAPTTRPVKFGEDPRAGRWSDSDKVECGLHV